MKFLVIDSIAKSGTTLLSVVLRSLQGCETLDGSFVEHFAYKNYQSLLWPFEYGEMPLIFPNTVTNLSIDKLKEQSKHNLFSERTNGGKSKNEWIEILDHPHESINDLYTSIANSYNSKILGFRWNQQIFYSRIWLERSNQNFWITIIRNPFDRIYSNIRTHEWPIERALEITKNYDESYNVLKNHYKNFIIIKYEDLILDTDSVVKRLTEKLSLPYKKITPQVLIGANYQNYRSQGHRVSSSNSIRIAGKECKEFYSDSINQGKKHFDSKDICRIESVIKDLSFFKEYL